MSPRTATHRATYGAGPVGGRHGAPLLLCALAAALLAWLLLGPGLGALGGGTAGPDGPDGGAAPGAGPGTVVAPVPGARVSSGFGYRPGGMHYGVDLAAPLGTPIRAIADGQVIDAGPASGFGLWVRIRHRDGTVSVYGHMNTITTRVGAHVTAGEQIATVGARGQATGPHLHLETWLDGRRDRRVDPAAWFARHHARLTTSGRR